MKTPDLTPTFYRDRPDRPLLLVGHLSIGDTDFSKGQVSPEILDRLRDVCNKPVLKKRSLHVCPICGKSYSEYSRDFSYKNESICESNADVVVKGTDGRVYKAPVQIYHYVRDHSYLPPDPFIAAISQDRIEDMQWYAE